MAGALKAKTSTGPDVWTTIGYASVAPTAQVWASPIASGLTVGDGSVVAWYARIGCIVEVSFLFNYGSTSVFATPTLLLPIPPLANRVLNVTYRDVGTAYHPGLAATFAADVGLYAIDTSTTRGTYAAVTTTSPFTWVPGDQIIVSGSYIAA